ncbi:MAG: hypothetical protein QM537_05620 [Candidatus Symbiobacter sp.]|nr:hypothetical protein [Candidatus Symbiobacter sp.]
MTPPARYVSEYTEYFRDCLEQDSLRGRDIELLIEVMRKIVLNQIDGYCLRRDELKKGRAVEVTFEWPISPGWWIIWLEVTMKNAAKTWETEIRFVKTGDRKTLYK